MPDPFDPSTATRSPNQTSRSNGFISPVNSRPLGDDGALAGAGAPKPQLQVLLRRALLGRTGLLELREARLSSAVARGELVAGGGLTP